METEEDLWYQWNEYMWMVWCGFHTVEWFGCNVKHTTVLVSIKISKSKRNCITHFPNAPKMFLCSVTLNCVNLFTRRFYTFQIYVLKIRRVNKVFAPAKCFFQKTISCSILILILIEHAVLSCAFGPQKEFHSYGLIIKVCYWVYLNRHYNQLTSHAFHLFPYRLARLAQEEQQAVIWTPQTTRVHCTISMTPTFCSHICSIARKWMNCNRFCDSIFLFLGFLQNFPQSQINPYDNLNALEWLNFLEMCLIFNDFALFFQSVSIWLTWSNKKSDN